MSGRAWLCSAECLDGPGGIYRAPSRSAARHQSASAAVEYYFYRTMLDAYRAIRCVRAPEFDAAEFSSGTMPQYIARPSGGAEKEGKGE